MVLFQRTYDPSAEISKATGLWHCDFRRFTIMSYVRGNVNSLVTVIYEISPQTLTIPQYLIIAFSNITLVVSKKKNQSTMSYGYMKVRDKMILVFPDYFTLNTSKEGLLTLSF